MRTFKDFIVDIAKKPPILFPLVGLFHVVLFFWLIWSDHKEPFPSMIWLQVVWMAAYTVFWIAACDFRKWGAWGYLSLTVINVAIFLAFRNGLLKEDNTNIMFLLDVIFSFALLYYYKTFR